ncbi:PREDICTED: putative disease resistance protein RGA1 [Prunus mume]|uniref:Disease resistance protein RGA1 n=1 Tax=Prunus mume TaxID=102107 RepID=A0ABM0PKN8_PRUMU|nr:PREDICTED: putative disease resistance protein RGA1 [Prunus mume]
MADVAFELASKLIEKLSSIAYDEICLVWGVKADLQKLGRTMSAIKAVLLDAEEKQAHNKELRSWLQQLKDVFLDAEDLLDEFECQALRKQTYHGTTRKVRHFFSPSNPIAFRLKAGHEIKGIRERLDELKANKAIFDLLSIDHHGRNHDDHHSSVKNMMMRENMTHSFVRPSEVIGRDSEKKEIVDLLLQQGDNQSGNNKNVSVIPIVGIGGLGKTTLAKLLYNDERVVRNFELRMWVYVSVDFDLIRITKEILSSALDTEISDKLSIDQLQGKLRDALKDKKFFLVLDDVWIDDRIKWSEFRDVLIDGAKLGSKILVTTRNISVASVTSTVRTYVNLKGLSNEDCLSLFVKCAFVEEDEKKHPNLFQIGKDIVRKCGGVPLAVRTLGSQLYSETDERKWKLIRDSEIWELEREGAGHILPALRLSYTQLPSHLKNCLAYCLLLPKGTFGYYSLDLIYCWMAHGILQPRDHENLELEDVGELYFKELWARSFFEHVELVNYHYNLSYRFSMHDLIHDLVQSLAEGEFSIVNSSTKNISENVRHLPILELGQNGSTMLRKLNKVRTITARGIIIDESFLHTCLSRFKYLRMLGLFDLSLKGLPSSIGTLKHLRYLDLAGNDEIKKLPNTICKLQSLQSLGLLGCENLENLPRDTSNLTCLRLLFLTTKQTSFSENGVGCLKSLRFLCIWNCGNLTSLPSDMSYLAALRTLVIYKCKRLELVNGNYQVIALRLQKLVIDGVPKMLALPEWLQGAAETLQDCYIIHCDNLEALPGWLTNFTSLRKLVLESCRKLLYLPEKVHPLELTIENCPKLERRC